MMYDEFAFERWSNRMDMLHMQYTHEEEEEQEPKHCSAFCDNEATVEINGEWYCEECAKLLE